MGLGGAGGVILDRFLDLFRCGDGVGVGEPVGLGWCGAGGDVLIIEIPGPCESDNKKQNRPGGGIASLC